MIPAEQISASALYSASLRNVPNLVSRDRISMPVNGTEEMTVDNNVVSAQSPS